MSRTDKDRPYWVIMNDRSLGTVEHHDHRNIWRRRRTKIVERGERQLVPYGEHQWFLRHTDGIPGMTVEEDQKAYLPYGPRYINGVFYTGRHGALRWYYEQPQRYEWVGRVEREVRSESSGCDIGPHVPGGWSLQPNCTVEPTHENRPYLNYYNRPQNKEVRQDNERRRRRAARMETHKMAEEYNTHGEVDDSLWVENAPPHSLFGGGWWD